MGQANFPWAARMPEQLRSFPGLAELLPKVATADRTVIVTSVNEAWARPGSLLDLFRESFRNGEGIAHLLNHTLVVAVDAGGFARCRAVHPHCYLLEVTSANVSAANRFLSKGYLELVWAKLALQQRVLQLGYNYLFTDVDVMWLRDPFRHISLYADVTMSCDGFSGDPESLDNSPNTGFFYVKSTPRTVEMLRYWRAARSRFPPHHDQKIFDSIKRELAGKQLGVRIAFLDTALFGTFCDLPGEVGAAICTMHANCCFGLDNKVLELRSVVAAWKNYTSLTPEERKKGDARVAWPYPRRCRAAHLARPAGGGKSGRYHRTSNSETSSVPFKGLAELLPRVAMEDRTVIITSVNEAWAQPGSLLDLYLESFRNGEDIAHLLDHLLVVALDARGFDRCKAVHPHCFLLNVTSVDMSSAKRFMSKDYLELVWTKLTFQQRVLELGYNFLFTARSSITHINMQDCDMVWFRNPFRRIPVYADMSCSSDDFKPSRAPLDNPLNTGLYYMKSTNRTVEMMKYWRAARERFPGRHDQAVFVRIRHEVVSKLQVKIEPLDTVYFGGFCEYHDDPEKICTMHADCCIGLDNKVHDLGDVAADWKNYTGLAPEARRQKQKGGGGFKWSYPTRCRDSVHWRKEGGGGRRHAVSFLLGAALPTALLFFLASDHLGESLSSVSSSWGIKSASTTGTMLPTGHRAAPAPTRDDQEVEFLGLAELLPRVSMEDRTVILTPVNEAWARPGSLLDLYLESFKNGEDIAHLLNHVLVVALDALGFDRCKAVHPHCYLLNATSVDMSSAKRFMSKDYLELVWAKLTFQQRDCDMIWFRNPLRRIPVYADMSCSSDDFKPSRAPLDNPLNTGLYYMKSTNRTVEMVRQWRAARARFPGRHDQAVFVLIRRELVSKLQVTIQPLETVYFGGFCEYHDDPEKACTMHADCCIGLENKVHDLKDIAADWRNYTSLPPEERKQGGLAELLPSVATDDRTVIITSVNEAFARPNSLLGLFRESFRGGEGIERLLDHVLVVAVDAMAFAHCKAVHPHCYLLEVRSMNLSSENSFLSDAYVELVWTKLSLQQRVLELGYNFLFTDVDIVWFRNPFRHISVLADMTTSSDIFHGDAASLDDNWPNTGFYYVKASNRTVEMLRRWRAARARFPPKNHEQAVFNHIKRELAADLGVRIRFLDTARFAGFCRIFHSDMGAACTMHANCCFGLRNKLQDLRDVFDQWRNYTGLAPHEKTSRKFIWKNPASNVNQATASPLPFPTQSEFPGLAELLPRVATEDRTVIFTSVTELWTRPNSLLGIFLDGFRNGKDTAQLLDHLLVVAVDAGGFHGCKAVHPHCYLLEVKNMDMSNARSWGSREYMELVWLKLSFQQRILELGYNFLYTDTDILWLRNPFRHISVYADMSCSLDNSRDKAVLLDNEINCGFYYMKSTRRSVEVLRRWVAGRARFPGDNEQVVLSKMKRELVGGEVGARIEALETQYVSGFCDFQRRLDRVCTVHANCCMGLENKVYDLGNVAADWKNYTSLTPEQREKAGGVQIRDVQSLSRATATAYNQLISTVWLPAPAGMATSKNNPSLSPVVVFLLGAASAVVLLLFFLTATARPAWPALETGAQRSGEVPAGSASVRCGSPRANGTPVAAEQHTHTAGAIKAPPADATTGANGGPGEADEFARMLRRAAMEDRTVIMTSVNEAWAAPGSLLDTFLESFRVGENVSHFVKHIVVVAMDEGAFRRCQSVHRHCHLLRPEKAGLDLSGAKSYMTKDYLDLQAPAAAAHQMELGYNLLFTDVDVAWFRNPLVHITAAADITTSSDFYFGDPDDLGNFPNTGFIYFKSTPRNVRAMAYWHAARRRFPENHDQFVFNEIKRELAGSRVGVRIRFIDAATVSGFCQLGRDLNRIATVHMTCCIGLENKLFDLKRVVADWKRYMAHPLWERRMENIGWTFEGGNFAFMYGWLDILVSEDRGRNVVEAEFAGLAELLPRVATEDGTVIMTSVNEVWTRPGSLLDIFLDGFRNGDGTAHLLNHVLVVAVDAGSLSGCRALHPHCYLLEVKSGMDMNRARTFGTREYVEMIWLKLSVQQRVLELGYNFLFTARSMTCLHTDADILWLRNPFQRISVYADMSCSLDNSKMAPDLLDCESNVGFYYMKSTNRSVEMVRYWRAARARFDGNLIEQVVFNKIKHELIRDLGARIQPLETEYISGFCDFQDRLDKVCTVHANCCMGLDNKVHDLRNVAVDWRNYTSLTPEERKGASIKVTAPIKCRKSMGWTSPRPPHLLPSPIAAPAPLRRHTFFPPPLSSHLLPSAAACRRTSFPPPSPHLAYSPPTPLHRYPLPHLLPYAAAAWGLIPRGKVELAIECSAFMSNTFRRLKERYLGAPLADLGIRRVRAVARVAPLVPAANASTNHGEETYGSGGGCA
ncbi:LOW QUALITY PROTEIN: hypothetical protein U9M48_016690 [Paspalum notatum var. saurae]|uniref:Nucleotide-diphospho-sugar transferase domain-containing protein n=1 Tax=Paspalum notatum var. saurae TaxID=547442 RepID=A0AAQ3T7Z4_PASNO